MAEKYSWISFYKELAQKLLDYKHNREKLISLIKDVYKDTGIHMAKVEKDGSLIDIDPFTFFGLFNKQIAKDKRIALVTDFGRRMNVSVPAPDNYDGLPVLNNQNAAFFMFAADRGENDIDCLWELFDYALRYANNPTDENKALFSKYFDICINLKHNGNAKITMALFWIAPDVFVNLDSRNEWFIYKSGRLQSEFVTTLPKISTKMPATVYFELLGKIKEFINEASQFENFIDLSNEAWRYSNEINKQIKEDEFWPTLKEYNPKITVEKWVKLLNNESIFGSVYKGVLAAFYKYGPTSCSNLDSLFDDAKEGSFRSWVTQISKKVHEETKCPLMPREDTTEVRYWPILFVGRNSKEDESGSWIYKLRDELYEALTEINILNYLWVNAPNYWLYEPGHKAMYWDEIYNNGVIQLSGIELGDLSQYKDKAQIKSVLEKAKSFTGSVSNVSTQSFEFYHLMKPGDIVYVRVGNDDILGRGVVESDYSFDSDSAFPHKRSVNWTHKGKWTLKRDIAIIKELTLIDKKIHKDYPNKLEELFKEDASMKEKIGKNIILYGPPGTGKTYNTVNYAAAIIEKKTVEQVQKEKYEHVKSRFMSYEAGNRVRFITFHQSYGYEDFIEGIKPIVHDNGEISYKVVDGVFKEFCDLASKRPSQNYVFIIDEINRGNISKIFGELITLIEESKRSGEDETTRAILPYSKKFFSVPNNVYILGTMNTADRSIALMDTALRRRFDFIEMMPRTDVLDGIEVEGVNISEVLRTINERITLLYDREHTIGHAFFMPLKKEPTVEKLAEIFENKLIPLLQEYFYEDYEKIQLVLGDNGKEEQFKFIKDIKVELKNVFKKSSAIDFELPEVKCEINKDALLHIESYKEII